MTFFAPQYPMGVLDVDVLAMTVQMESPATVWTIQGRTIGSPSVAALALTAGGAPS